MHRLLAIILVFLLLTGCAANTSSSASGGTVSSEATSSASTASVSVSSVTSTDTQCITSMPSIPSTVSGIETVSSPAKIIEGQNSLVGYGKVVLSGNIYTVEVMQIKYMKPPQSPEDEGWSMFTYGVDGDFDVVVLDGNGKETDRLSLNQYCKNQTMGYPSTFDILFLKDFENTQCMFGVYCSAAGPRNSIAQGEMPYIMFNVDSNGKLAHLPVDSKYFYKGGMNDLSFKFCKEDSINSVNVGVWWETHYTSAEYVWDGDQYVLRKS